MFNFWKKSICIEKVQKYLSVSSFLACTLNRLLIHLRRCCCLWQMTHFWPREILSNFPRSCKGFQLHLDTLHYVLWCIVSSQELWRILKVKLADLSIIFKQPNARCSTIWMMTLTFQWFSCEVDYGSFVCTEFYRSGFSLEIIGESLPWHLHHYVEHTSLLKVMLAHMQMPVGWPVACGGEGHVLGKLFTFKLAKWKPSRQRHHFPSLLNWVHGDAEITFKRCHRRRRIFAGVKLFWLRRVRVG